jgi:hypothetical protein
VKITRGKERGMAKMHKIQMPGTGNPVYPPASFENIALCTPTLVVGVSTLNKGEICTVIRGRSEVIFFESNGSITYCTDQDWLAENYSVIGSYKVGEKLVVEA